MPTADLMRWLAWIVAAFLLGSIPFGLLVARAKGVDIRKHGSGNIGATNVGRVLGGRYFALTFACDFFKGMLPTLGAGLSAGLVSGSGEGFREALNLPTGTAFLWLAVVVAGVLGHMFTPFGGFKGGKGVATGLGALIGIFPVLTVPAIGSLAVFLAVLALWRYVSAASICAAAALPFFTFLLFTLAQKELHQPRPHVPEGLPRPPLVPIDVNMWPWLTVTLLLAILVIVKHRANMARLAKGTEPKVGQKKKA